MKKIFLAASLISSLFLGFLASPINVFSAEGECASAYGTLGYSCAEKPTECNDSSEIKLQTKPLFDTQGKGTLKKDGYYISGVCKGEQVCCVKKPVETETPPAAAGSASTTSNGETCGSVCQWIRSTYKEPENYDGPIPECAFSGTCRNTNDLVQVFVDQGKNIFGMIGMVALAAFVYGGFLMVFSFGASDKVQQGKDVMVAAVIGIVIVFTAYLLVNFVLNALGVSPEFQAIK